MPNHRLHFSFSSETCFSKLRIKEKRLTPTYFLQSAHENRIYSLKMQCGDNYPDEPPSIQFVSQVNLPCVNPRNGVVDPKQLPCLAQWKRENTMEMVLIELRRWAFLRIPNIGLRIKADLAS